MDGEHTLIEACITNGGTGPDRSDPIHGQYLLLDQLVQFYLDRAIITSDLTYVIIAVSGNTRKSDSGS